MAFASCRACLGRKLKRCSSRAPFITQGMFSIFVCTKTVGFLCYTTFLTTAFIFSFSEVEEFDRRIAREMKNLSNMNVKHLFYLICNIYIINPIIFFTIFSALFTAR